MVLDRFSLPCIRNGLASAYQNTTIVAKSNDALALVPYRPSLHAVLITFWAAAQPDPLGEELAEQHGEVTLAEGPLPATLTDNESLAFFAHLDSDLSGNAYISGPVSDDLVVAKKMLGSVVRCYCFFFWLLFAP